MTSRSTIERNTVKREGELLFAALAETLVSSLSSRHNIIELIETEKEYVKDLALIVEVRQFGGSFVRTR